MSTKAALQARIAKLEASLEKTKRRKKTNVNGGSGDVDRGMWCTPTEWSQRLGSFDLDPFSNPRSTIDSTERCMLEDGGNGLADLSIRGSYRCGADGDVKMAGWAHRVFIQPPYEIVLDAIAHYGHTSFCALLRFDPSTEWFRRLYKLVQLVAVPRGQRMEFEPPPGVDSSSNPYPHAFYFARAEDATPALLRACIAWRVR